MKAFILNLLCVIFSSILFSQTPEWRYLSNSNKVNKYIESFDYYWQGTEGGLLKTDKVTKTTTRYDRSNSLLFGNTITGLAMDNKGDLWVSSLSNGDYGGVTRHTAQGGIERMLTNVGMGPLVAGLDGSIYFLNTNGLYHFINNKWDTLNVVPMYQIPGQLAVDPSNGEIWFTTYTFGQYGVTHFNGITAEYFDYNQGLPFENPVSQPIAISSSGQVFVSTGSGIYKKTGANWTNIKPQSNEEIISAIAINSDDELYACYQPKTESLISIIKYENDQWIKAFDGPIFSYFGYTIKEMQFSTLDKDKLILPTAGYKCWTHKDNAWSQLESKNEIAEVRLTQLSRIGNDIWVVMGPVDAYDSLAVLHYNGKDFNSNIPGLPTKTKNEYLSILGKDADGITWAKTQYALYRLENNNWVKDSLIGIPAYNPAYVELISGSQDGRTLLYHNSYAYIKTNGIWNEWKEAPQSTYNTHALWDSKNRLFVSDYYGWSYFDGNVWKDYNTSFFQSIKFLEAPDHSIYIFTGYQLLKLDPNASNPVAVSIPTDDWFSITIDSKAQIWLASVGQLIVSNGNSWTSYDRSTAGYIGSAILNIEADNNDNIWIATYSNGLELFNPIGIVTATTPSLNNVVDNNFSLYPNPNQGSLTIKFNDDDKHVLELINSSGAVMGIWDSKANETQIKLPENIVNGIYWMRTISNGKTNVVPLIIEK